MITLTILKTLGVVFACLLLLAAGKVLSSGSENTAVPWGLLFASFAVYFTYLVDLTLLSDAMGRGTLSELTALSREEYLAQYVNFTPFETLGAYCSGLLNGTVRPIYFLFSVVGNFIILMPFAYYLPRLFPVFEKPLVFIAFSLLYPVGIEGTQYFFRLGSCDVDDYLLNAAGLLLAFALYCILRRITNQKRTSNG